jgi:hypothetical protein
MPSNGGVEIDLPDVQTRGTGVVYPSHVDPAKDGGIHMEKAVIRQKVHRGEFDNIPLRVEHREGSDIGYVRSAKLNAKGEPEIEFVVDESTIEGIYGRRQIESGKRDLSLGTRLQLNPDGSVARTIIEEVSVCRKGYLPDTPILSIGDKKFKTGRYILPRAVVTSRRSAPELPSCDRSHIFRDSPFRFLIVTNSASSRSYAMSAEDDKLDTLAGEEEEEEEEVVETVPAAKTATGSKKRKAAAVAAAEEDEEEADADEADDDELLDDATLKMLDGLKDNTKMKRTVEKQARELRDARKRLKIVESEKAEEMKDQVDSIKEYLATVQKITKYKIPAKIIAGINKITQDPIGAKPMADVLVKCSEAQMASDKKAAEAVRKYETLRKKMLGSFINPAERAEAPAAAAPEDPISRRKAELKRQSMAAQQPSAPAAKKKIVKRAPVAARADEEMEDEEENEEETPSSLWDSMFQQKNNYVNSEANKMIHGTGQALQQQHPDVFGKMMTTGWDDTGVTEAHTHMNRFFDGKAAEVAEANRQRTMPRANAAQMTGPR